ncbi:MAG: septum formation initiator family protein [Chrysiogenales bacterium]|nr:MAG: septum formation initiator family protein [Chrysiogenales bacterium]
MGIPVNQLRKQVASERKKRKLILLTVVFLSFLYLLITLIFGDMGLLQCRDLFAKKMQLEAQVKEIEQDNARIRSEITSIREDPFYKEKHAREDFGLARPDEYIFQYDR